MVEDRYKFIDLDGVILDSQIRVLEKREKMKDLSWDAFFEVLDWDALLSESKQINNSVDIIKERQAKKEKLAILTKIHTLKEGQAKINDLRNNRKIEIPIILVPPHIKKSQIYLPRNGEILIDDSVKNLKDWENQGGRGYYFNEKGEAVEQFETIKTLRKIL